MQSARIWYDADRYPVTLAGLSETLTKDLGYSVQDWAWTLGSTVIPQLRVTGPVRLLMQIEDDPWVEEEAEEFATLLSALLTPEGMGMMLAANARIAVGDAPDGPVDPAEPATHALLLALARHLAGVFEDNVNGGVAI